METTEHVDGFDLSLLNFGESTHETPSEVSPVLEPEQSESEHSESSTLEVETETPQEASTETPDVETAAEISPREKALLDRIEQLTGQTLEQAVPQDTGDITPVLEPTSHNFLDGVDIDEVLGDSTRLNALLIAVHDRALQNAAKLAAENIMRNLPRVVSNYVSRHATMKTLVDSFYTENPDLVSVKRTVGAVANEIAAEHPELSTAEVFKQTAVRTRELLHLQSKAPANGTSKRPAFVRQKGRANVPELQGLAREIDDLLV